MNCSVNANCMDKQQSMKPLYCFPIFFLSQLCHPAFSQKDSIWESRKTDSVVVTAEKKFIRLLPDKTVLVPANQAGAAGQNLLDYLRSAPGVMVDADENLKMSGKSGVTVLIDGRNIQLSGQDLAQMLKSIEADNVKEIEIIPNPSAKFDAAGNAGIINIRLLTSMYNGINGAVSAAWVQSTHARQNGSASFNARKGDWNFYGTIGANHGFQITRADNERTDPATQYIQKGEEGDRFGSVSVRTGVDKKIGPHQTLGLLWMYQQKYSDMDNRNLTRLFQLANADTGVLTQSIAPFHTARKNINLNYQYQLPGGLNWTIDIDNAWFNSTLDNLVNTRMIILPGQLYPNDAVTNNAGTGIRINSIRSDFETLIGKKTKLETGLKSVFTQSTNQILVQQQGPSFQTDTGRSNQFSYKEQIHAVYISMEQQAGKWKFKAGARAEFTKVNGRSVDLKNHEINQPDTAYINLFPTLFIQYQPTEQHSFSMSAGRRIDRPGYQDQNPFIYVLDAFNSEEGNPYLQPQISWNLGFNYAYKQALTCKLSYSYTDHYIESITYRSADQTINIPQNVGNRKMLSFDIGYYIKPAKWLTVYGNAEPFYQRYDVTLNGYGFSDQLVQGSWGFNAYLNTGFSFEKKWRAEIIGWYNYQNRTTIYRSLPYTSVQLGLSKKILNEKATVRLSVNDLFNSQRWDQTALTKNINLHTWRKWESQNLTVSFSWRFGNNKIQSAREREAGAKTEIDRIK